MSSCASRTSSKENEEVSSLPIEERTDLKESTACNSPKLMLSTTEAPLQIDTSPSRSGVAETKCLPPARTLDKNILIASSKINLQERHSKALALTKESVTTTTTTTTTAIKSNKQLYTCYHSGISENLTNQHLKCANTISKSSRSNSIDQLIAAAAVTAQSSACMSPLSPLNSPIATSQLLSNNSMFSLSSGASGKPDTDSGGETFEGLNVQELNLSRKNLNTIVEAIFHVEGASRLDELVVEHSMPSSSYLASSSTRKEQEQQQKPPKKRKYTGNEQDTQPYTKHPQGGNSNDYGAANSAAAVSIVDSQSHNQDSSVNAEAKTDSRPASKLLGLMLSS